MNGEAEGPIVYVESRREGSAGADVHAFARNVGFEELRVAEQRMRQWNEELERSVAERTAELERANQLARELLERERRAREEAQAASRAKDDFLAMLSHELRTPLNAMGGWVYLLRSRKLDVGQVERAVDVLGRNVEALGKLIDDLLDVSSIVAGRLRLDLEPVVTADLVHAVVEGFRPVSAEKGVQLVERLDGDVGRVAADAQRLRQIVLNLLSNALKFTPASGIVEVRVSRGGPPEAPQAEIAVRDTGKGIAPEFLPHVFERFRQAEVGTGREHGGLGLGLAIVQHLTELHGGSVQATSAGEGMGSTFTVRLPALPSEPLPAA